MPAKLTVKCNITQKIEREVYSEKNISKLPIYDKFAEFGIDYDRSNYYLNKYIGCYVLTEKQGYTTITLWYDV
jgi:hypothetical protein